MGDAGDRLRVFCATATPRYRQLSKHLATSANIRRLPVSSPRCGHEAATLDLDSMPHDELTPWGVLLTHLVEAPLIQGRPITARCQRSILRERVGAAQR